MCVIWCMLIFASLMRRLNLWFGFLCQWICQGLFAHDGSSVVCCQSLRNGIVLYIQMQPKFSTVLSWLSVECESQKNSLMEWRHCQICHNSGWHDTLSIVVMHQCHWQNPCKWFEMCSKTTTIKNYLFHDATVQVWLNCWACPNMHVHREWLSLCYFTCLQETSTLMVPDRSDHRLVDFSCNYV